MHYFVICALILFGVALSDFSVNIQDKIIATSSESYVSFNFDWHLNTEETPAWVNCSILVIDLDRLSKLAKGLSPGNLRIGGSEEDEAVYDINNPPDCATSNFCLTMARWHKIVNWAKDANIRLVFGLNAMRGRNSSNGMTWDHTNVYDFLKYTADNKLEVYGFEFGNELEHKVDVKIMANDYLKVREFINELWPDVSSRPKLIGPDENLDVSYLDTFLPIAGKAIDILTWHCYIGYGLDKDLSKKIITPTFLNKSHEQGNEILTTVMKYSPHVEIWVGETAAAWHSGQDKTTNAFISGFWYIDQLGTLAQLQHKGFCRQTLMGGYYELVDKHTFEPNPDYWTALLWTRLMSSKVLSIQSSDANTLRSYAHCTKDVKGAVTLALINLSTEEISVNLDGLTSFSGKQEQYMLTATDLRGSEIDLNGKKLELDSSGDIPSINPAKITSKTITLGALSYGYFVLLDSGLSVCN